jgi:hypothetical protein
MKFGASMFFTDYSMTPAELATALEQRGFDIVWAPEHSHIPLSRKTSFVLGGDLPKRYYDVMDPFVSLSIAAAVTKTLKIGTGGCLIAQRDPDCEAGGLDRPGLGRTLRVRCRQWLEPGRDGEPRNQLQNAP